MQSATPSDLKRAQYQTVDPETFQHIQNTARSWSQTHNSVQGSPHSASGSRPISGSKRQSLTDTITTVVSIEILVVLTLNQLLVYKINPLPTIFAKWLIVYYRYITTVVSIEILVVTN